LRLANYKWFQATPAVSESQLPDLVVRRLGLQDYIPLFESMRYLAEHPKSDRADQLWLLSHKPVYTQGQAGGAEHILNSGAIPVIQIDRGGQVTYHGPGQLVVYLLLNIKRRAIGVRQLVDLIEQSIIATLAEFGVSGQTRPKAPGVYVNDAKIAALGLRIKNGWSYHGLSLNIKMDLAPFAGINPCGFENLQVCQLSDFQTNNEDLMQQASKVMCNQLLGRLGYQEYYPKNQQP
jgi:lipoyl(octanoyl) transferase